MAAKPKLTPEQWADVRARWEDDPREGYTWLVEEMSLPVSAPAVRKAALRDEWRKASPNAEQADRAPKPKPAPPAQAKASRAAKKAATTRTGKAPQKGETKQRTSKVSKVSENHQAETISKTMKGRETMPVTTMEALERDPDQFGVFDQLTDMQELFVREYMTDWNGTQAAIRAGYSAKSAHILAWELLKNPKVRGAIEALASARARRLGIDADELLRMWAAIVNLDMNEISQLRRVCCPFCWSEGHTRQYTPSGLEDAKKKHDRERQRRQKADANDDIGEFPEYTDDWYDKRKPPHEDCPECHGEGRVETFFADTRHLSPAARLVYAGVKEGRDGIEVLTMSKEKASDNLARALGLFKDKEEDPSIKMVSGDELVQLFDERMRIARERQAAVMVERGLVVDVEVVERDGAAADGSAPQEQADG